MNPFPWQPGTTEPNDAQTNRRAARIPLTRGEIVYAGLRIVVAEGIDAVSMRRVASEFDTGPSTLYAHVTNKDELLQLMFEEVCGQIAVPEPDPKRWKAQVKDLALAAYHALLAHNDLARAALGTIPTGPNALRVSDAMLGMMTGAGIPPRVAWDSLDRIFLYLTADAYETSIWRAKVQKSGSDKASFLEQIADDLAQYYREIPAETYPHLHRYADDGINGDVDDRFAFGLDLIVDGLEKFATTPGQ